MVNYKKLLIMYFEVYNLKENVLNKTEYYRNYYN